MKPKKNKPSKPSNEDTIPAHPMTGEQLAAEFMKLSLSEHLGFQQAMAGMLIMGKMPTNADTIGAHIPNESLYLIRSQLRSVLAEQGVQPRTLARLMKVVIGDMAAKSDASVAYKAAMSAGKVELKQVVRKSRRKRP